MHGFANPAGFHPPLCHIFSQRFWICSLFFSHAARYCHRRGSGQNVIHCLRRRVRLDCIDFPFCETPSVHPTERVARLVDHSSHPHWICADIHATVMRWSRGTLELSTSTPTAVFPFLISAEPIACPPLPFWVEEPRHCAHDDIINSNSIPPPSVITSVHFSAPPHTIFFSIFDNALSRTFERRLSDWPFCFFFLYSS